MNHLDLMKKYQSIIDEAQKKKNMVGPDGTIKNNKVAKHDADDYESPEAHGRADKKAKRPSASSSYEKGSDEHAEYLKGYSSKK